MNLKFNSERLALHIGNWWICPTASSRLINSTSLPANHSANLTAKLLEQHDIYVFLLFRFRFLLCFHFVFASCFSVLYWGFCLFVFFFCSCVRNGALASRVKGCCICFYHTNYGVILKKSKMVSVFTKPNVNTREVGRTRDKRRKPFYISFIK